MANVKTPTNTQALAPKTTQAVAAKKSGTVADYLQSETFKKQFAAALPENFNTERFIRAALTEFRMNPVLGECSVPSVLGYFLQAAACGLEPASSLGHCYPVPFNNKKTGQKEVQFIIGYRGMLDIVRRSGEVASIDAHVVHEKDEFELEFGLNPKCKFKPYMDGEPGAIKGAYVQVDFKAENSKPLVWYMPKAEIDKHRARSKADKYGDSPWKTDYESMCLKTLVRSAFKWLPVSIEQAQAVSTDSGISRYHADAKSNDFEDLVEVEFIAAQDDNKPTADEAVEQFAGAEA